MKDLQKLVILLCTLAFLPIITRSSSYIIDKYNYSSQIYNTIHTYDFDITELTTTKLLIRIIPSVNSIIYLSRGILLSNYSLFPLTGFHADYKLNRLPSWASFDKKTTSIKINAPDSFSEQSIEISYHDARSNFHKIQIILISNNNNSRNIFDFFVVESGSKNNIFTIVFPIFLLTGNNLASTKSSNYGALTNIFQYPWLSNVIIYHTISKNTINVQKNQKRVFGGKQSSGIFSIQSPGTTFTYNFIAPLPKTQIALLSSESFNLNQNPSFVNNVEKSFIRKININQGSNYFGNELAQNNVNKITLSDSIQPKSNLILAQYKNQHFENEQVSNTKSQQSILKQVKPNLWHEHPTVKIFKTQTQIFNGHTIKV